MALEFTEEQYSAKIEWMVEAIANILTSNNIGPHAKKLQLAWLPEIKDIPVERWLCENITVKNNEIHRMSLGIGYIHEGVLARREYCELSGIKYNFSEWEIFNKKQLD